MAFFALAFSGCSTVRYLIQAGKGQLELSNRSKPLEEVLKDPKLQPRVKRLLAQVEGMKKFGESKGLKPTKNYTEFVNLDRAAVVYVVSACEPLKFQAKQWSFPIVGSFTYLGWFDLDLAKKHAAELKTTGLDVDVRGAGAYSTLGWFRDPILSTMLSSGLEAMGELADVILHESVHATFYVAGQSSFNESIASFVGDQLALEYLEMREAQARGDREFVEERKAYLKSVVDYEVRRKDLHAAYGKLDELYRSSAPDSEKLAKKSDILAELKKRLGFQRDINNATLIQYKTYDSSSREFESLFAACGKDWARFWKAIHKLTPESFGQSQAEEFGPVLTRLAGDC